ncbi:MAG: hypothetical protein GC178_07455 [Flavobacteriales bacterium]|nr:hypothetical protein [Flavobacteriales bacterium]
MKQQISLLAFLLSIAGTTDLMAQRVLAEVSGVKVTATDVKPREAKETVFNISDLNSSSFNIYIKSDTDSKVETYDGNLKLTNSESVKLGTSKSEERKDADYFRYLSVNGQKYALSIYVDNGENIFTIAEVGNDGLNKSEPTEFLRLPKENAFKDFKYQRPSILISDNGSYALLAMKLPEPDNSDPAVFTHQYVMFGPDMQVVWNRQMKYDHSEGIQRLENEIPLNDGAMLSLTRIDKGRGFGEEQRFEQRLYHINAERIEKTGFPSSGKVLLALAENQERGILAICTYGLRSSEGLLIVDWNLEQEPNVKKVAYGIDHLTKKVVESKAKKLNKDNEKGKPLVIDELKIRGVKKLPDGRLIIHGQERWLADDFNAGPIHFFCLDKDMNMVWSQVIPVRQIHGGTDEGLGYFLQVIGDDVYVVFNDNYKNVSWDEKSSDPSVFSGPDNPVVLVHFDINDPEGTYSRKQLWDSKDVGGMFSLSKYFHNDNDHFGVAYIQGGHLKECLIKIEFGVN